MNEQKTFVSRRLLLYVASVIGVCAAMSAYAAEITESGVKLIKESKEDFQNQDKEAAKSLAMVNEARLLVADGKVREADEKYSEAIVNLQDNVVSILELQVSSVDSWRAKQRFEEFSKLLAQLQSERAGLKMDQAEKAMLAEDFDSAIMWANEAKSAYPSPAWEKQTMEFIRVAIGKRNAAVRQKKTSAETSDPGIKEREIAIKRALAEAWVFYRNGKYKESMQKVEDVYALNPYNADAAYLASLIWKQFYVSGISRRKADIQAQLAYEAWQWVEPAFPIPERGDSKKEDQSWVKGRSDAAIQMKLDQIRLSDVPFNEMNLEEAIRYINSQSKKDDPAGVGVKVELLVMAKEKKKVENDKDGMNAGLPGGANAAAEAPYNEYDDELEGEESEGNEDSDVASEAVFVTAELKNVSVRELLDYLSQITGMSYVVRDDRVVFGSDDTDMYPGEYTIANTVKAMITGKTFKIYSGGESSAPAQDEFADDEFADDEFADDEFADDAMVVDDAGAGSVAAAAPEVRDSELTPQALRSFFDLYGVEFPKGSSISYYRGKLVMRNTADGHRRMESVLKIINSESDMIEVEVKSIEIAESDMEELGFNWSIGTISNNNWKLKKGDNTAGDGAMLKMLDGLLSGVDSRLISNLNIFPDLFGSFKPFGIDETLNITLTINALDRSDRTEQISAPRVLVANGVTATVKMTKSYFFPEDWDEMEVETEDTDNVSLAGVNVTPPTPQFAETETDIGTVFTVTPTIKAGGKIINLKLEPTITAYTGKDEYEVVVAVERLEDGKWVIDPTTTQSFTVWRPVIATRALKVDVNVNHGETLVIGGLSDSQSQKRLDKIPILADIPFIGRLFQNQSEISTRRNMLIFVTARLVDHKGVPRPLESFVGNGGIPALVR